MVPRWRPFLLVLGLVGMVTRHGFRPLGDPDTWWHLRLGDEIWHNMGTPANVPNGLNASLDRLPVHTVVFNDSVPGGWLLWRHPTLEPVIDGRAEAFPKSHFVSYIKASQVRAGWEELLQDTDSKYALVETDSPLATALNERLHWRSLGEDDGYVLLAAPP